MGEGRGVGRGKKRERLKALPPKKGGCNREPERGGEPGGRAETPRIQATEERGQGAETRETNAQREAHGPNRKTETQKEQRRESRERRPETGVCA